MADEQMGVEMTEAGSLLRFRGPLDRHTVGSLWRTTERIVNTSAPEGIILDLQAVEALDSVGVAYIRNVRALCSERNIGFSQRNIPESLQEFLQYVSEHSRSEPGREPRPSSQDPFTRIGLWLQRRNRKAYEGVSFFGEFLIAFGQHLRHPRWFHISEILYHMQLAGVGAVPLIVSLSLLLGMLMVFQGAHAIHGFGPKIYIADMVVIAVTREMGPLLVAVVLAGRSGAAFAAEIGTMKVNEELDALTVMDLDVTRLIVLPRVFALTLVDPVLTMISDLVGIIGGMTTGYLVENIPIVQFVQEVRKAMGAADIYTGLIKSVTFGIVIGFIGCYSGLRTGTGAGDVGIQTTTAVVSGIFMVILIDTIYSYIFNLYGL